MAKNKLELNKVFKGTAILNASDLTLEVGGEIVSLKEKLADFDGEQVRFSFTSGEVLVEDE